MKKKTPEVAVTSAKIVDVQPHTQYFTTTLSGDDGDTAENRDSAACT